MSIFSAVGDFFRGPFENDEEKKKRKQREQQEAQQRAAQKNQPAPKPQVNQAPNQTGLPMAKMSVAKPLGPILNTQQNTARIQASAPKATIKQSFWNKLRDVADANTDADKLRRQQAGLPTDYKEAQKAVGEKAITNPFAKVGFEFAKPIAQGVNTLTSAGAGLVQQTKNLNDLLNLREQYKNGKIDKATYNKLSKEIAARGDKARYGEDRGILGVGGFYKDTKELDDPKKLAGTILQTGGSLAQVMPQGKALEAGLAGKQLLGKEIAENLVGGLSSEGGRQISEGKFDPKALAVEGAIDVASPVGINKLGQMVKLLKRAGVSDDVAEKTAREMADAKTPKEAEQLLDDAVKKPKAREEVKLKEKLAEPDFQVRDQIPVEITVGDELNARTRQEIQAIRDNPLMTPDEKLRQTQTIVDKYKQVSEELQKTNTLNKAVVDENAIKLAAKQKELQGAVADVQKVEPIQAPAGDTPAPGQAFNDSAYVSNVEDSLKASQDQKLAENIFADAPTFEERGKSTFQILSPDRVIREKITNPLQEKANRAIANAQTSDNVIARLFGRATQGMSREAGVGEDLLTAKRRLRGGIETGKIYRDKIYDLGEGITDDSKRRIWASLDPEQAGKIGQATDLSLFTPEELAERARLKAIADVDSDKLFQAGLLSEEQWKNKDYFKRSYNVFEGDVDATRAYTESRDGLLKQLKARTDVDEDLLRDAVTDPYQLAARKSAEVEAAVAMVNYGKYLDDNGLTSEVPRPGYEQLPNSKLHGPAAGKYVPRGIMEDFTGFKYTSGMINAYSDMVSAYDNLAIRKGKKALLTVANPAVRAGNQFSNRIIFSNFNGINPIQFNMAMSHVDEMARTGHQLWREAVAEGLTGTDITAADFAQRIAGVTDENVGKKALNWIKSSYSKADDKAKVAAYVVHRQRGYSPAEAARLTQRGFQDYNSVGFFYDLAAKTPLIGNAFVRFAADSIRIAKNAALDHPLRSAGTIAMWATFVNEMSKLSGESAEDKKTREDRFGAPKIPFTDISMTVQTPWGEVNVARFMPFYQLNDLQNPVSRVLPIANNPLKPEGWQDPLLGQVAQVVADKDFRGKSIRDPENVDFGNGQSKFQFDPLSGEEKRNNLLRFLFTQNAPVGREIDALNSARQGKEDIYGKERSLPQAILRSLGVKVEQFDSEQAKKTRGRNEAFDRMEEVNKEVAGMTPSAQEAYRRLTGQYKLRDEKTNPFDPSQTINVKAPVYDFSEQKWGEYMQNPQLFDVMEKKAQEEAKANGSPLRPEFDPRLPKNFRLQLIQQKSIAPGDDIELQERMYSDPLWDTYQAIKDEYKAKAKQYYPESNDDFTDELVKHQDAPFPKKPPLWQAYTDAKNRGEDPGWSDQLQAAREQYEMAKLNWTNNERAVRGLPSIPAEVWFNKTFGYTADKNGSGYGRGGKGGYQNDWGKLGELMNTSIVKRLDAVNPKEAPALASFLKKVQAGSGGGRRKPTLGAASRGTG